MGIMFASLLILQDLFILLFILSYLIVIPFFSMSPTVCPHTLKQQSIGVVYCRYDVVDGCGFSPQKTKNPNCKRVSVMARMIYLADAEPHTKQHKKSLQLLFD